MLEPNKPTEHTEFLSRSPIIHAAIAGRKLTNKKKERAADSQHLSQLYGSQESNMRGILRSNMMTEKSQGRDKQLSPHVGVLKLPESLKLQHLGESYDLEQVAKPGSS